MFSLTLRHSDFLTLESLNGCLGCNACQYEKPCVQKDDYNVVVPKIKDADIIVFASPLYFWTIISKIKAFIERLYCAQKKNPSLSLCEKYPAKAI